jgi:hypothetical protein
MNKHPAILVITVAALWVSLQIVIGRSIWGNTWKKATLFTIIAVILSVIATIFISIFYE